MILRDSEGKYDFDNMVGRISKNVKNFNDLMARLDPKKYNIQNFLFQLLVGLHPKRELWWFDKLGLSHEVSYKSLGSGEITANEFLSQLPEYTSMEEFATRAWLVIKQIEKKKPALGVGTDNLDPTVWFLPNDGDDRMDPEEVMARIRESVSSEMELLERNNP